MAEASVQGWFSDARIPPETTRSTPVWLSKNRDWRQDPQIQAIPAACEDGSWQYEHCIKGSRPSLCGKEGGTERRPSRPARATAPPRAAQGSNAADSATHRRRRRATTASKLMCGSNSPGAPAAAAAAAQPQSSHAGMLISCQIGKGPRQPGTHAIREQREAQVELT